ncbi:MAG: methyl-accepting chemotaxis protein [Pseudomonadota bacterium]
MANDASALPEIASRTFMAVGPSRIAALTLALLDAKDTAAHFPNAQANRQLAQERISAAIEMLEYVFPRALEECHHRPTPALEDARKSAFGELTKLGRAAKGSEHVDPAHCLDALEPAVTQFLELMREELVSSHKAWQEADRDEALDAIKAAETVGKSIKMIAFNASIEAARVGDHGRGFMVIADEVSTLAARTEGLLKDIYRHIMRT